MIFLKEHSPFLAILLLFSKAIISCYKVVSSRRLILFGASWLTYLSRL